jgi:hypothetical protein
VTDDAGKLLKFFLWSYYKISSKSSSRLRDYVYTRHLAMTVLISTPVSS